MTKAKTQSDSSPHTRAEFVDELILVVRHLNMVERDAICCGTVTVQQCWALQRLLDGPLLNSELAADASSSVSATTRLVDGLIKHGWAERTRDDADRRKVFVSLTPAGTTEAKRLRGVTEDSIGVLLEQIDESKHDQVVESIRLLRQALDGTAGLGCC